MLSLVKNNFCMYRTRYLADLYRFIYAHKTTYDSKETHKIWNPNFRLDYAVLYYQNLLDNCPKLEGYSLIISKEEMPHIKDSTC